MITCNSQYQIYKKQIKSALGQNDRILRNKRCSTADCSLTTQVSSAQTSTALGSSADANGGFLLNVD